MGLPAGLRKRGEVYYVQFKEGGRWKLRAVGRDLDVALAKHRELRKELEPVAAAAPQGASFEEVLDRWLSSQETRCKPRTAQISHQRARVLRRLFGGRRAAAITAEAVEELIRWRRAGSA